MKYRCTLALTALALTLPAAAQSIEIAGRTYNITRLGGPETAGGSNDVGDLTQPTYITQAPGDDNTLYIVERSDGGGLGRILQFDQAANTKSTFFDINGTLTQDGGLLTMAFHPDYQTNGKFYVSMVEGSNSRIVEYDATNAFASRTILSYNQPASSGVQHTINWAGFQPGGDPDALYITAGDGGWQANNPNFDPAIIENLDSPYGKLLRIDVSAATDFTTPVSGLDYDSGTGNALGSDSRVQVIANGMRNPYRAGFDLSGGIYISDVGFQAVEEVSYLTAAQVASGAVEDLGWTEREGSVATPVSGIGGAGSAGDIDPIFDYLHPGVNAGSIGYTGDTSIRGQSATGGYVFDGRYYFGDFVTGRVYSGLLSGGVLTDVERHDLDLEAELTAQAAQAEGISWITSFGQDNLGNLYIIDFGDGFFSSPGTGEIFRLARTQGDLNGDGVTDEADLDLLLGRFGSAATLGDWSEGDIVADGVVNARDLDAVLRNWSSGDPPSVDVPEPAAAGLVLVGLALLRRRR